MFLIALTTFLTAGELKYKLAAEGGIARASNRLNNANFVLTGLDAQVKLVHSARKFGWYLQTDIQPEFFLRSTNITSFVFNAKGQYFRKYKRFNWGIKSDYRFNQISATGPNFTYNVLLAGGYGTWLFKRGNSLGLNAEYTYRDIDASLKNSMEAFLFSARWLRILSLSTKISAGIYAESFYIDSQSTENGLGENNGWRIGPEFAMDYKKRLVLNATYRLISHKSQVLNNQLWEHWIRLVFGKILSPKWSVFLLTDFYIRNNTIPPDVDPNLFYTPLSSQNRFYFKLGQELNRNIDTFLKIGYTNEDLIYEGFTFSGWRGTVGLEIRN